jgi:hypothetical protein
MIKVIMGNNHRLYVFNLYTHAVNIVEKATRRLTCVKKDFVADKIGVPPTLREMCDPVSCCQKVS